MKITLKDGSVREYDKSMSVYEIASDISEGLARVAMAGEVNGEVVDLRTVVSEDCELNILTFQDEGGKDTFLSYILAYFGTGSKAPLSGDEACYWASHCGRLLL